MAKLPFFPSDKIIQVNVTYLDILKIVISNFKGIHDHDHESVISVNWFSSVFNFGFCSVSPCLSQNNIPLVKPSVQILVMSEKFALHKFELHQTSLESNIFGVV